MLGSPSGGGSLPVREWLPYFGLGRRDPIWPRLRGTLIVPRSPPGPPIPCSFSSSSSSNMPMSSVICAITCEEHRSSSIVGR